MGSGDILEVDLTGLGDPKMKGERKGRPEDVS